MRKLLLSFTLSLLFCTAVSALEHVRPQDQLLRGYENTISGEKMLLSYPIAGANFYF